MVLGVGSWGCVAYGSIIQHEKAHISKELDARFRGNSGLGDACEGAFHASPECANSEKPEVLPRGDS